MNKKLVIVIAIVATIFTLGALVVWYIWRLRREVVICDIAHEPNECELLCREIYRNAANVTEGVRQNFSDCIQNCYK